MERTLQPDDAGERDLLLGWLAFHRDALAAKCAGLSGEQLVAASAAPSDLTLAGLVRHMTEMERVYLVYALGGGEFRLVYCTDDDPEADIAGLSAAVAGPSIRRWHEEWAAADALLDRYPDVGAPAAGNRRSVRWNLVKLIQEYARHNGHADLIRERIDGATGE